MNYLMGLCIGTSSTKGIIADIEGKIISSSLSDYKINAPNPGWTEQDPGLWLEHSVKVIKDLLKKSEIDPLKILCMGITGQMHSGVFLDGRNNVIRPAPLWNDQRTFLECEQLIKSIGLDKMLKMTSNKPTTAYTLPKILWLRKNEPGNFKKLRKFCLSKDYIKLKFSGNLSTDPSDASATLCFDVKKCKWSQELMDLLGLDSSILPEVKGSGYIDSFLSKEASKMTGLPAGLPVLTGAGDAAAEMLGNGIGKDGDCLIILGTGGVILNYHSNHYQSDGSLDMFSYPDGSYFTLGVTLSSSASLMWGLDSLGFNICSVDKNMGRDLKFAGLKQYIEKNKFKILDEQVNDIPAGSGGLIFLPYLAGERAPYSDPDARGVLFGLKLGHDKRHVFKSIMEGVAFSQRDCYEIIKRRGLKIKNIVITGGGSKNDIWCQVYADIFNCRITRISSGESAALGMCILGAVSSGVFSAMKEANKVFLKEDAHFVPNDKNVDVYNRLYEIYCSLYPALKKAFCMLGKFDG